MSSKKSTRRRFLADLLFMGGALSAGAFLSHSDAQVPTPSPTPKGAPKPVPTASPSLRGEPMPPQPDGDFVAPQPSPTCAPAIEGESRIEPIVEGKSVAPRPQSSKEK